MQVTLQPSSIVVLTNVLGLALEFSWLEILMISHISFWCTSNIYLLRVHVHNGKIINTSFSLTLRLGVLELFKTLTYYVKHSDFHQLQLYNCYRQYIYMLVKNPMFRIRTCNRYQCSEGHRNGYQCGRALPITWHLANYRSQSASVHYPSVRIKLLVDYAWYTSLQLRRESTIETIYFVEIIWISYQLMQLLAWQPLYAAF